MPVLLEVVGPRAGAAPLTYRVTEPGTFDLQSVFAHFNGAAASGSFRPVVTIKAQNGTILARVFPSDTLAAGDSADVTYAPFLRGEAAASAPTSTQTWFIAGFNDALGFQDIPDSVTTLLAFDTGSGWEFGDGYPVERAPIGADFGKIRFYPWPTPRLTWVRLGVVWDTATCLKRLSLGFTTVGTPTVTAPTQQAPIEAPPYAPYCEASNGLDYQELVTIVSPFGTGIGDGSEYLEMQAYAYQNSGSPLRVEALSLDVFIADPYSP